MTEINAVEGRLTDGEKDNIDMLSLSGHKFHAPKGVGALYCKKGIKLQNFIEGGAQERNKRGGTEAIPGILAMAAALGLRGVLTFLGSAMIPPGALRPLLETLPAWAGLAGSILLFVVTREVNSGYLGWGDWVIAWLPGTLYRNLLTAFLGFPGPGFYSTDYFSLMPWLFLFWAGYFLQKMVGRERMEPLRASVCPPLGWMGRHSLLLYLLHQPVIYGVLMAWNALR